MADRDRCVIPTFRTTVDAVSRYNEVSPVRPAGRQRWEQHTTGQINVGTRIEISFNGEIAESYPAQIFGCYEVKVLC